MAEVQLRFAIRDPQLLPPAEFTVDPEDRPYYPGFQSMYADGSVKTSLQTKAIILQSQGVAPTEYQLFDGSAELGGPDTAEGLQTRGDWSGLLSLTRDSSRNVASLAWELLSTPVRVPTNNPLFWHMDFEGTTGVDDPFFFPEFDAGVLPSGSWFEVELVLVDSQTYSLRAIPEPTSLSLLALASVTLLRRRRT